MISTGFVCLVECIKNLGLCEGFCETNTVGSFGKKETHGGVREDRGGGLGEEHRDSGFLEEQRSRGLGEEDT